jgi:hypothetical protein
MMECMHRHYKSSFNHKGGDMAKKGKKETFEKRLKVYSVAAAGVLAIAPAAEAAIHYSGIQNLPVSSSQSQNIDFDGSGPQFSINYHTYDSYVYYLGINELTANAQHIKGTYNPILYYHNDALNLPNNYQIGSNLANFPRAQWYHGGGPYADTLNGTISYEGATTDSMGNFNNATGYIGVRFQTQCGLAYGWIHYQGVTSIGNTSTGTIIDWAYEDNCQPIVAGQTQSASVAVPTMNQWGMILFTLLLGGIAARMLGKQEKEEN